MPRRVVAAAVAFGALAATACGADATTDDASTGTIAPVQSGEVRVSSIDNIFRPEQVTVTVGTEVRWTNDGRNDHNILPVGDTPFRAEADVFAPGDEYTYTMTEPGTYRYYCSIHGTDTKGMIGTIQVVPEGEATS